VIFYSAQQPQNPSDIQYIDIWEPKIISYEKLN